jgi:CxxC-x17-CxxC domain-containing protein
LALKSNCKTCGNEFLIINKEIEFYKEKDLPTPVLCPNCRLERRISMRNKKELLGYNCDKCGKDIIIAFDPPEGQQVYCKTCFQQYMQQNDCILGQSPGMSGGAPAAAPAQAPTAPATEPASNEPFNF